MKKKSLIEKYIGLVVMPIELLIFMLSHIIPKNKKLILFSAWGGGGFYDNPKSIFERMIIDRVDRKVFWITKSKEQAKKIEISGYPVAYSYSINGIWMQLRAHTVVFTHQVNGEFLSYLISDNVKRVQACHGIPIKKIDADDLKDKYENTKYLLKKYILRYLHNHNDLVLSCSQNDRKILSQAFRTSIEKIKITGYPRNDLLITNKTNNDLPVQIIYMPTFRGEVNSEFLLLDDLIVMIDDLEDLLEKINGCLNIKLHPVQKISSSNLEVISNAKRIKFVDNTLPVYQTLNTFDILITDFSSVYFDYLLLGKPIIMAPLHENEYLEFDRSIYYSYDDLCIMSKCQSWNEISKQIEEIKIKKIYDYGRHALLLNKFHVYKDCNSSKRAYIEILKI